MKRRSAAFAGAMTLIWVIGTTTIRCAEANENTASAPQTTPARPGAGTSISPGNAGTLAVSPQSISEVPMKRVTGIGGVFFKAKDAPALREWYKRHLGIDVQTWGGAAFHWTDADNKPAGGSTAWLIAAHDSKQFAPGTSPFMVDYRVENLDALLRALKAEGCNVLDETNDSEYGKFGWVIDPEGNKVELWEPPEGQ
jgi:predicted enzyme related to lactoylglutathione lyase